MLLAHKDNAIAEYAQRVLRERVSIIWPSPRGGDALSNLRGVAAQTRVQADAATIEGAIAEGEAAWQKALPDLWTMVRGKYIIGEFVSKHTVISNAADFVNAVVAHQPKVAAMQALGKVIDQAVGRVSHS